MPAHDGARAEQLVQQILDSHNLVWCGIKFNFGRRGVTVIRLAWPGLGWAAVSTGDINTPTLNTPGLLMLTSNFRDKQTVIEVGWYNYNCNNKILRPGQIGFLVPKPIWAIVQFNNLMFLKRFFTFSLIHCTAQAVLPGVDFLTLFFSRSSP